MSEPDAETVPEIIIAFPPMTAQMTEEPSSEPTVHVSIVSLSLPQPDVPGRCADPSGTSPSGLSPRNISSEPAGKAELPTVRTVPGTTTVGDPEIPDIAPPPISVTLYPSRAAGRNTVSSDDDTDLRVQRYGSEIPFPKVSYVKLEPSAEYTEYPSDSEDRGTETARSTAARTAAAAAGDILIVRISSGA